VKNVKPTQLAAAVGAAAGATIAAGIVAVYVLFGNMNGLRTLDMLSFALIVAGIVITALTVLGSFTVINTWNDIDEKTHKIMDKYERDAKAEIERNAEERQRAINQTGDKMISEMNGLIARLTRRNTIFMFVGLGLLCSFVGASLARNRARK
jgi:hypothetical protein